MMPRRHRTNPTIALAVRLLRTYRPDIPVKTIAAIFGMSAPGVYRIAEPLAGIDGDHDRAVAMRALWQRESRRPPSQWREAQKEAAAIVKQAVAHAKRAA